MGLFSFLGRKAQAEESVKEPVQQSVAAVQAEAVETAGGDEIIAVIAAAIAAVGAASGKQLRVASFRRIPQTSPVWNQVSRTEYIAAKL